MNKKVYQTYKENIYISASDSIKTDGYYLQLGELHPRVNYRKAIIFYDNGYTIGLRLSESKLEDDIKTKITHIKDSLLRELDWWKVNNDSLIIEHYGETNRDMVTWNYFERGKVLNDTLIELRYDDSSYKPIKFKFIKFDSLPKFKNKGRYLKKDWYHENLNENRKTTANN
jgi:hypothetical protein